MGECLANGLIEKESFYDRVAKNVVLYLKNRMMLNQALIQKETKRISLKDYINELNDALKTKDQASIYRFITRYNNNIIITEEEINDLMYIIQNTICEYGLQFEYGDMKESEFICNVLKLNFDDNSKKDDVELKKVDDWLNFFSTFPGENRGFAKEISGSICIPRNNEFSIINQDSKVIYAITDENEWTNKLNRPERIIVGANVFEGTLHSGSSSSLLSVFLATKEDGKLRMNPILFGDIATLYDVKPNDDNQFVSVFNSFHDDLKTFGLDDLIQRVYTQNTFLYAYTTYLKYKNMCNSAKQRINVLATEAADICINVLFHQLGDDFFGEVSNKFTPLVNDDVFELCHEDRVQVFKEELMKGLKVALLNASKVEIGFDQYIEPCLKNASLKAGLDVNMPKNFRLVIKNERIYINFRIAETGPNPVSYCDLYEIFDASNLKINSKNSVFIPILKNQQSS